MSSAVVSTSAALGRPFLFDDESEAHVGTAALGCPVEQSSTATHTAHPLSGGTPHDKKPVSAQPDLAQVVQSTIKNQQSKISLALASRLEIRPAPEMVPSGIPALDTLTGGLPRGCLTEICGSASSGRTTVLLAALAAATRRGEYCALIDASDTLDPKSLAASGADLDCLLWVRCGDDIQPKSPTKQTGCLISAAPLAAEVGIFTQANFEDKKSRVSEHCIEQVLRATDLLLESGGFGLIILDLADLPPQSARRIPLTTWFRFRRAVEHKPTILLAIEQHPIAGSCSSLLLQLEVLSSQFSVSSSIKTLVGQAVDSQRTVTQDLKPSHTYLLTELEIHAELTRSRLDRKPAHSVVFETKTAWAG